MIRILIAAWLLKTTGAKVNFVVRRRNAKRAGKGTTWLTTDSLKTARTKYNSMRIADTDTITISVEAVIAQRKENNNA